MGLLDKIVSMLGSNIPGVEAHGGLFDQVIGLINNPDIGGLPGLISKFEKGGLGDVVSSLGGNRGKHSSFQRSNYKYSRY